MPTNHRLTCLRTDAARSCTETSGVSLLTSDAPLRIVTDNKAASVETGSTLFEEDIHILTQSSRGQAGCSGLQHLCHMCYQNPQLGCTLPS